MEKYYSLENEDEFIADLTDYMSSKASEDALAEKTENILDDYQRDVERCNYLSDYGKEFIENLIINNSISGEIYTDTKLLIEIFSTSMENVLLQLDEETFSGECIEA